MTIGYKLSQEADNDIADIFDYTEFEYGLQKAIEYTTQFSAVFIRLYQELELRRSRDEIRAGLRSLIQNKHVIFYRILNDHIRIVKVLDSRSDIPRFLDKS